MRTQNKSIYYSRSVDLSSFYERSLKKSVHTVQHKRIMYDLSDFASLASTLFCKK